MTAYEYRRYELSCNGQFQGGFCRAKFTGNAAEARAAVRKRAAKDGWTHVHVDRWPRKWDKDYCPDHGPAEACPAVRREGQNAEWPCVLGMAHNPADPDYDPQQTVHRDRSGTGFRVARCRHPSFHGIGITNCWCTVPEHHVQQSQPGEHDADNAAAKGDRDE